MMLEKGVEEERQMSLAPRLRTTTLEIWHIETGSLVGGQKWAKHITDKVFSEAACRTIADYFRKRLSFASSTVSYRKLYVATYWSKPTISTLQASGIEVVRFPDFLHDRVLPTIRKWKETPFWQAKGKTVALRGSFWLLQLLEHLEANGMLGKGKRGDR